MDQVACTIDSGHSGETPSVICHLEFMFEETTAAGSYLHGRHPSYQLIIRHMRGLITFFEPFLISAMVLP